MNNNKHIRKFSLRIFLPIMTMLLMGASSIGIAAENPKKSQSLARLDADAAQLNSDMLALHTRLQDIHKTLWVTKKLLAVPGYVATDLRSIESGLKMLDGLINTAQAVPELREDAKKAKQELDVALREVSAAREKAEAAEKRVAPFKPRVETADNWIQKIDTNAERFRVAIVNPMPGYTNIAQTCVSNSAQANMPCMQRAADRKADSLDAGVKRLDQVVKLALTDAPDLISLKKLDTDFDALDTLRQKMDAVLKRVHAMESALKELDSLLKKNFHESFPYPDPTWKNPLRISHYEIKVSMRTILKGSKAIEDEIEKILSKSLWKAAKIFGVGKLVNSLKHQAEKECGAIKSKLHLNQSFHVPELAQLDGLFGNIDADIARFPSNFGVNLPDISVDMPSINYRGLSIDVNALKKLMGELAPHGISGPAANLCAGVSYGCTAAPAQNTHVAPSAAAPKTPNHGTPPSHGTTPHHGTATNVKPHSISPPHMGWPGLR